MTRTARARDRFAGPWRNFMGGRGREAPPWLQRLRRNGLARFQELGFPTQHSEDWRFTNLAPIRTGTFELGNGRGRRSASGRETIGHEHGGPRLVFFEGRPSAESSRIPSLPEGVVVCPLAQAIRDHPRLVEPHLDRLAQSREEALSALNSAFLEDGLFAYIPPGCALEGTIQTLFVSGASERPTMSHPRNLVIVDDGGCAQVTEEHICAGTAPAFTNPVTEIVLGARAECAHYLLGCQDEQAISVATLHAEQARESRFASHSALLGGALVRNNIFPALRGIGCESLLNGFYVPKGRQHHDTFMVVRHEAPACASRQFYRGILDEGARAVFSGRIIVREGAQGTDAKQTNRNLLLSEEARIDTKPQLEIYANDVKCTHGATVGQLDPEAMHYLRCRGIPEETARGLLVFAFVNEVLQRMDIETIRERLGELVRSRLPGGGRPEGQK